MYYLIDFENVSNPGLTGLENLTKDDTIIIFYSKNANNFSMQNHIKLEASCVSKEYIEVTRSGKNALDFQLATYLGALVAKSPSSVYTIISKDEGFSAITEFWKIKGTTIKQFPDLTGTASPSLNAEVEKLLPLHQDKVESTTDIITKYKTKQGINNALVKAYKSEVAGIIYKAIKPLLKDKK